MVSPEGESQKPSETPATPTPPASGGGGSHGSFSADDVEKELREMTGRWGVKMGPLMIGAAAAAVLALIVAFVGHISYLTADDALGQFHGQSWLTFGLALSIACAALAIVARRDAADTAGPANQTDLLVGAVFVGAAFLWAFLALIMGFSKKLDAENSWAFFGYVFAFFAIAWMALSRPVPRSFQNLPIAQIVLGAAGVLAVLAFIGFILGLGDGLSSLSTGAGMRDMAITIGFLSIAAGVGLESRR